MLTLIQAHDIISNSVASGSPTGYRILLNCLLKADEGKRTVNYRGDSYEVGEGKFLYSRGIFAEETGIDEDTCRYWMNRLLKTEVVVKAVENRVSHRYKASVFQVNSYGSVSGIQPVVYRQPEETSTHLQEEKPVKAPYAPKPSGKKSSKYASRSSVTPDVQKEIADYWQTSVEGVASTWKKLTDWEDNSYGKENGKYSNYKQALSNWVQRDVEKGILRKTTPPVPFGTEIQII